MKLFQILNGFCYHDESGRFSSVEAAKKYFPSDDWVFVEAPDYVFESWGFDETKEGDKRFIKPTAPEGFIYNEENGTFRPKMTAGELRERAYNEEEVIDWNGKKITVTRAAQLWQFYAAEDNLIADDLQDLIYEAKQKIREKYTKGE